MANAKPLKLSAGKIKQFASTDTVPIANLATGTPTGTKFIRDDGVLAVPAGGSGVSIGLSIILNRNIILS